MEKIQIFQHEQLGTVRTLTIDGAPWFVGKDVCDALGYEKARNAITAHVDEEDALKWGILTNGGTQEMTIINESGLYSLILSSKLPRAKEFKRWVTAEVLPSIRKTGSYSINDSYAQCEQNANHFLGAVSYVKTLSSRLIELSDCSKNDAVTQAITKAETLYQVNLNCLKVLLPNGESGGLITATAIGQHFGKSARDINLDLLRLGFITKDCGQWIMTRKGQLFGKIVPFRNNYNGYSNQRIMWQPAIIDELQAEYDRIIYV